MKRSGRIFNRRNRSRRPGDFVVASFFSPIVQPKLSINSPNDRYEQEANAMANIVMQSTADKSDHPSNQYNTGIQRQSTKAQSSTGSSSIAEGSIRSGGQPMDHSTLAFMENRFGYNFDQVRIHNDTAADESSRNIHALAYTHGHDIVFASGQYQPQTDSGKRLLAHELTHIIQQQHSGGNMIQREFVYKDPSPREKDPIPIVYEQEKGSTDKAKTSMGLTTPTFNGKKLSEMSEHDLSGLFVLKAPGKEEKGKVQCSVDSSVINAEVSAEELIITQSDKNHQWKGSFRDHQDNSCKEKSNIQVVLNDTTAGKDLYDIILKNENDHVNDLKKIIAGTNKFLGSIDKFSATGKDEKDCNGKLIAKINKTANPALGMANEFLKSWQASVAVWDKGKHTIKKDPASISKNCTKIELNLHQ